MNNHPIIGSVRMDWSWDEQCGSTRLEWIGTPQVFEAKRPRGGESAEISHQTEFVRPASGQFVLLWTKLWFVSKNHLGSFHFLL